MVRCFLALGGNVGDVSGAFDLALAQLDRHSRVTVVRRSSNFRTRPVGESAGADFLNAAVEIETSLEPLALLDLLQEIEEQSGRARETPWGPRPLDLDIIFYGDRVVAERRLQVPHPACWYRRFVLDPLASIAPEAVHPVKRLTVAGLRERLLPRPLRLALTGATASVRALLQQRLAAVSNQAEVLDWSKVESTKAEPAIIAWLGPDEASTSAAASLEALPEVARLDVSRVADPAVHLRDVLKSALG